MARNRRQSNPRAKTQKGTARSSGRKSVVGAKRTTGSATRTGTGEVAQTGRASGPRKSAPSAAGRMKGMGLRAKFMLVMSILTAVGMCVLGFVMAATANTFLINQSRHQGIELAKMASQLGRAALDSTRTSQIRETPEEIEARIRTYLEGARTWDDTNRWSFIDSIQFQGGDRPGFTATGTGNVIEKTSFRERTSPRLTVPGRGSADLSTMEDIEVYKLFKKTDQGEIPVYRFNVAIPQRGGLGSYLSNTRVQVDVAIDTIDRVSLQMYLIVGIAVVVMIALVMVVANVLAGRITRPVHILMKDMRVVAQGDLDHRTKAHSADEVGVLAQEFNLMTQNLKEAQSALVEQEKAEYELHIAQEVQQQLLPAQLPEIPGFEPASFYKGAKAVSGDYYDFIPLGNGLWGFIVADVSGKGIPGSMVMAVTRTIVRLVAEKHLQNAAETLKETNRKIAKQIKRGMFVTAFYAVLDTRTGVMTMASAGHNPMVIYRHQARKIELAGPKGIAIGFNEGPLFDKNIQQVQLQLESGDIFAIYTDGFPEAMNEDDEEFGDEPFYKVIGKYGAQGAQGVIDGALAELEQHRGAAEQSDDLTILCVRKA